MYFKSKNYKNNLFIKIFLVLFIILLIPTSTLTKSTISTPVHYWSMDNLFGSQTGNPVVISNDCKFGKCISFDGSSGITTGGDINSKIQTIATYTFWIKTSSDINTLQYIFTQDKIDPSTGHLAMGRGFYIESGKAYFVSTNAYNSIEGAGRQNIAPNTWYFVELIQNKSQMYEFLNGMNLYLSSFSSSSSIYRDAWCIGCADHYANGFKGIIDDIKVYSTAFTETELNQIYYNNPVSDSQITTYTNPGANNNSISQNTAGTIKLLIDLILILLIIAIPIYTIFSTRKVDTNELKQRIALNSTNISKSFSDYSRSIFNYSKTWLDRIRSNINGYNGSNVRNENINQNNEYDDMKTKFCFNCGTNIDLTELFCPNCGERQLK